MRRIVIPGRFPGLNDFIDANRRRNGNWSAGNKMKQADQATIRKYLPKGLHYKKAIFIEYNFYEPNTRRDKDNISGYFHKVFQDALVQEGIIDNDSWKYIRGMTDYFEVDRLNPRIEVFIEVCK